MLRSVLASVLLPPIGLVLLALLAGLLAASLAGRRRAWAGLLAALASLGVLLLATPLAAGLLAASLERPISAMAPTGPVPAGPLPTEPAPGAIIILGGDSTSGRNGADIGRLTLERLRAGAALARATGLPILVTGGTLVPGQPPLARMMAESLAADFGVATRWVEAAAGNTEENAVLSTAMLRRDGIAAAFLVTQAFHMPRALEAFARQGFAVRAAPVRLAPAVRFEVSALVPRSDHLLESWYAIHEWAGLVFYRLRDGAGPAS